MLETIAVILFLCWLFGMGFGYASGGLLHILLVLAVIVIIIRVLQNRGGGRPLL